MTTRVKHRRRARSRQRNNDGTSWIVIGGVIGIAAVILLLFLAISTGSGESVDTLAEYCTSNPTHCAFSGAANAPVTIVEISDFGCPHCRDFHEETLPGLRQTYIDAGQVRWITLPFALSESSLLAATAALCAGDQDAYFAFADILFANFSQSDIRLAPGLQRTAATLGLDMEAFNQCMSDGRYNQVIVDNGAAAHRVGVNSTPTFFINDTKMSGAFPFATFQSKIEPLLR